MPRHNNRLAIILTYLGSLPFLIAVFIALSPYFNVPEFLGGEIVYSGFKARVFMHSYGAVILAFLAGIQWGISLQQNKPNKLIIISNILAIMAWLSLMTIASKFALSVLLVGFIIALITDYFSYKKESLPTWFWQLRKRIS
ncbi:MAG: DUF3429 domain-containing protein, partial [Marinicellaceae bacterium]